MSLTLRVDVSTVIPIKTNTGGAIFPKVGDIDTFGDMGTKMKFLLKKWKIRRYWAGDIGPPPVTHFCQKVDRH
jgi:hypothetical protein